MLLRLTSHHTYKFWFRIELSPVPTGEAVSKGVPLGRAETGSGETETAGDVRLRGAALEQSLVEQKMSESAGHVLRRAARLCESHETVTAATPLKSLQQTVHDQEGAARRRALQQREAAPILHGKEIPALLLRLLLLLFLRREGVQESEELALR